MKPFIMDWRDNSASIFDISYLLDAPAGRHGFVTVRDGHLMEGDRRLRIWGINLADAAAFPPKSDARDIAAHLARFGVNCVRFHHMDRPAPHGLLAADCDDTRTMDNDMLDRLDFFIAELKHHGIYSDLNLNVSRIFKAGDGVRDYEKIGVGKALTYFNKRLIELQREYAMQLMTHRNPYTQSEYREEPSILIVEMVNENSIFEFWTTNRLQGLNSNRDSSYFSDIPPTYEEELTALYNDWLVQRLTGAELAEMKTLAGIGAQQPIPRLRTHEFADAPAKRFRTEAAFYMDLEETFFRDMESFLRHGIGVKSLLIGTSSNNSTISTYPLLRSLTSLDIVDGHEYWTLPELERGYAGGRHGFELPNVAEVDRLETSAVVALSRSAVAGKPFVSTETGHMFPSLFASEATPLFAAYAAFQDWDGIFWYTFDQTPTSEWKPEQRAFYEMRADPVKMTQLASGALMFLGRQVHSALETIVRNYSLEQVQESARLPPTEKPYFTPGFPLDLPLRHSVRVGTFDGEETAGFEHPTSDPVVSDTGELAWHRKGGASVVIDTPFVQGIVGHGPAGSKHLTHLCAEVETEFAAITLQALDGFPLARSKRMLLVTGARVANTGMRYNTNRKSLVEWGTEPTVIEPVVGAISLKRFEEASGIRAIPLDGGGKPTGSPIPATKCSSDLSFPIGEPATPWYLIEVDR
jgi:hypothetical protein